MLSEKVILITGLIRDGPEFKWVFDYALNLRESGFLKQIIFSTWMGEIDRIEGLRHLLNSAGIVILENDSPARTPFVNPVGYGNNFSQKLTLYFGLQAVEPGSFVIKARTDLVRERLTACIETLTQMEDNSKKANRLSIINPICSRIFTFDAIVERPFYWDDIVFTGTKEEMLEMLDFESIFDLAFDTKDCPTEVRFFARRFLRHYPVLEYAFRSWSLSHLAKLVQSWVIKSHDTELELPLPRLLKSWLDAQFHIISRYLTLPKTSCEDIDLRGLTFLDFYSGTKDGSIAPLSPKFKQWHCHKIHSGAVLQVLSDPDIDIQDPALQKLRSRLFILDSDPSLRGAMPVPSELPDAEAEARAFADSYGIEIFRRRRSAVSWADISSNVDFTSINIPVRKPTTWFQQRKTVIRRIVERKFFEWMYPQ